MTISPELGERSELELPDGRLRYSATGTGRPIVLLHGFIVNGDVWRKVVPALAGRGRCIVPDLPLGSHELPMPARVPLTMPRFATLVGDLLAELDLRDVLLVGNGGGTGIAQLLLAHGNERVAAALLSSGDSISTFPPPGARASWASWFVPGVPRASMASMRSRAVRRLVYSRFIRRVPDDPILDSYTRPMLTNPGTRRDLVRFVRSIRPRHMSLAPGELRAFRGPATMLWAREERLFPERDMRVLGELLPDTRYESVRDSRTLVPEDRPDRMIAAAGELLDRLDRG